MNTRHDQAGPDPAQTSTPEETFRKALEWICDDGPQFRGVYSAKIARDALLQAPVEAPQSPPTLDRNTALLLYDDLTKAEGLRRFYAFHMGAYNDSPNREYFEQECTLLAADADLQLAFLLRTPEGSYFEQRATCQSAHVHVDNSPLSKDGAREGFALWPLKAASLEEAFGPAAAPASSPHPEGGAA